MNRTQKKCLIVSAGLHLLLLGILLFGAALVPEPKAPVTHMLTFIDLNNLTDGATTGGSRNVVLPPPPAAAAPAQSSPQQLEAPQPPVKPPESTPIKPLLPTERAPVQKPAPLLKPDELKLVNKRETMPPKNEDQAAAEAAKAEAKALKAAQAARRQAANQLGSSIETLSSSFSSSTAVEVPGPGDGGPLSANYRDAVASKYEAAWQPPPTLDDPTATVTVTVTISRDGSVINGHIKESSGNAAMDKSIQTTLENVTYIAPFPAGSKDLQRTFIIKFNLAAKRSLG